MKKMFFAFMTNESKFHILKLAENISGNGLNPTEIPVFSQPEEPGS